MASNLNPKVMKSLPDLLKEKAISHKKLFSDYSDKNDEIIETDHLENKNEEKPENENEENKDVINRSKTTKRKKSKFKLLVKHEEKNENEDNVDNEISQKYIVNDGNFTEKTKNNNDNKISIRFCTKLDLISLINILFLLAFDIDFIFKLLGRLLLLDFIFNSGIINLFFFNLLIAFIVI